MEDIFALTNELFRASRFILTNTTESCYPAVNKEYICFCGLLSRFVCNRRPDFIDRKLKKSIDEKKDLELNYHVNKSSEGFLF
jgi:hypothetical protein